MKKLLLIVLALGCFVPTVVQAQSSVAAASAAVAVAASPSANGLMTITAQSDHSPMFQMGAGACLRGPMTFFDQAENVVFHLDAGKHFPAGCEKK